MRRVFFIGAGASVDDGFPVTRDLMAALAYAVHGYDPADRNTHRLFDYLHTVYGVSRQDIDEASSAWAAFLKGRRPIRAQPLPSIIEMLSVLDTVCQEGMSLGPAANPKGASGSRRNLDPNELRRIRDRVQRALIEQFARLHQQRPPATFERFVRTLRPEDVIITTNWDLLLDRSLDARFGPPRDGSSFGVPQASLERSEAKGSSRRRWRTGPLLLKLHGSLNWLWCTQCGALTIDLARKRRSDAEVTHDDPYGFRCPCGGQFAGLIVTPTFLKRYENHHIGAVWTKALQSLIHTSDWTFIGYSLPEDDIAIRALLLKALVANRRAVLERREGVTPIQAQLVMWSKKGSRHAAVLRRYRQICGSALRNDGYWKGFAKWTVGRSRARMARRH